jgi:hypothetical protein
LVICTEKRGKNIRKKLMTVRQSVIAIKKTRKNTRIFSIVGRFETLIEPLESLIERFESLVKRFSLRISRNCQNVGRFKTLIEPPESLVEQFETSTFFLRDMGESRSGTGKMC